MCLIVFSWQPNQPRWLTLAANRDEFFQRPTQSLHHWPAPAELWAGKDLQQGGTWLAVNRDGGFAALTNIRRLGVERPQQISRGVLVKMGLDILQASAHYEQTPDDAILSLSIDKALDGFNQIQAEQYAPFNLVVGDRQRLFYINNYQLEQDGYQLDCRALAPGLYGLSNAHLDSEWPKLSAAKQALTAWHQQPQLDNLPLLLTDTQQALPEQCPNTGIPMAMEQALSASFIRTHIQGKAYGTRSSAGIMGDSKQFCFDEIQWQPDAVSAQILSRTQQTIRLY